MARKKYQYNATVHEKCNQDPGDVATLHRILKARSLPSPVYTFGNLPDGRFKCIVEAASEKAEGIGTSKESARQESCTIILQKLLASSAVKVPCLKSDIKNIEQDDTTSQSTDEICPSENLSTSSSSTGFQSTINSKSSMTILHEYLKRKNYPFPIYNFVFINSEYRCFLHFGTQSAVGFAPSKDLAQEKACSGMLEKLRVVYSDVPNSEESKNPAPGSQTVQTKKNWPKFPCTTFSSELNPTATTPVVQIKKNCSTISSSTVLPEQKPVPITQALVTKKNTPSVSSTTLLSELLQKRNLPSATYIYEELSAGPVRCFVQAAGVKTAAIASSKKLAQEESAKVMLDILKSFPVAPQSSSLISNSCKQVVEKKSEQTCDYISKLNVYASKHGKPYPAYECIPNTVTTGNFEFSCSFMGYKTIGNGKSKREAKQDSAYQMLQLYFSGGEDAKKVKKKCKKQNLKSVVKKELKIKCESIENITEKVKQILLEQQDAKIAVGNSKTQIIINL